MKRVSLSTWQACAEPSVMMKKGTLAYQDYATKKVYSLCTNKVREYLSSNEDGSIIPNEEPVPEFA